MTEDRQKQILIDYLNLKVLQEDWRSVEDAARDLRDFRVQVKDGSNLMPPKMDRVDVPPAAIPIAELKIPHNASEVVNMLRMSDADLVDRLFPDYTQEREADAN